LFVEEKPTANKEAEADRLKLAKSMLDSLGEAAMWYPNCNLPGDLVVFGIQVVGLHVDIYLMCASIKEVTDFHCVAAFDLPAELGDGLAGILEAFRSMVLIKQKVSEMASSLQTAIKKSSGKQPGLEYKKFVVSTNTEKAPRGSAPKRAGGAAPIAGPFLDGPGMHDMLGSRVLAWQPDGACCIRTGRHKVTQAQVAVKCLRDMARFDDEIKEEIINHRLACQCGVPNVLPLLEVINIQEAGHASVGMVFPLLEPLNEPGTIFTLTLERISAIVEDISRALHGLHQLNIIHYDVSTGNILLEPSGRAVLADFGHSEQVGPLSRLAFDRGTPGFAAPESVEGEACTPMSTVWESSCFI
jgi:hypothetical protein